MRDKTEAAKILLDKGWTIEEVMRVLGGEKETVKECVPMPAPQPEPAPWRPALPYEYRPGWWEIPSTSPYWHWDKWIVTCDSTTYNPEIQATFTGAAPCIGRDVS